MKPLSRRLWWIPAIAAGSLKGQGIRLLATAGTGEIVFEFIGVTNQNGGSFSATGYLTAVAGLSQNLLFTDPTAPSQQSARFTFAVTATLVSRNVINPMFLLDETATATISYSDMAGSSAEVIVSGIMTLQSSVQVTTPFASAQSPGKGNFRLAGEFQPTQTNPFQLSGVTYQFGQPDIPWLISATGDGTLTDPNTPISQIVLAGNAVAGASAPVVRPRPSLSGA